MASEEPLMAGEELVTASEGPALGIDELEPILRRAWGLETCDPADRDDWSPDNPARGQCGVTALIVRELCGGELILGEVHVDGARTGYHYWNRLPGGREIDLTAEQFHPHEKVSGGEAQQLPPGPPRRCRGQWELLRDRVLRKVLSDR
jgi:hypothetical protein